MFLQNLKLFLPKTNWLKLLAFFKHNILFTAIVGMISNWKIYRSLFWAFLFFKFRLFKKSKKFEKIFHLEFDVTMSNVKCKVEDFFEILHCGLFRTSEFCSQKFLNLWLGNQYKRIAWSWVWIYFGEFLKQSFRHSKLFKILGYLKKYTCTCS